MGEEGDIGDNVVMDVRVLFGWSGGGRGDSQLMQSHKQSTRMARMWAVQ